MDVNTNKKTRTNYSWGCLKAAPLFVFYNNLKKENKGDEITL